MLMAVEEAAWLRSQLELESPCCTLIPCLTRDARPETWEEVAASDTEDDRGAALEQLGGYLDVVETQLLKEIAVRFPGPRTVSATCCAEGSRGVEHRPAAIMLHRLPKASSPVQRCECACFL